MISAVKKMLPSGFKNGLKANFKPAMRAYEKWSLRGEFRADRKRYERFMIPSDSLSHDGLRGRQLEGQLTKDYHRVEKGLALKNPKPEFGTAVQERIVALKAFAIDEPYYEFVTTAESALNSWNTQGVRDDRVSPVRDKGWTGLEAPESFFNSRHSVRDFKPEKIELTHLERATKLAINTPSVCNRQAWLVRYYSGEEAQKVLSFQNGNKGFGQDVPVVALITVDSRLFATPGERNQPWIEGGLFSMSLVWAFHAIGIDSCMLNLSITNDRATGLKEAVGAHESEQVIMMIAIGKGREGHRRARSSRRAVSEVMYLDKKF